MATAVHKLLHPLERHHEKKEAARHPTGPLHDRNDSTMDRPRDEEKHTLAQWEAQRRPLSHDEIDRDPETKPVGHSSKVLREDDFELIKTLGTGTFARVWLVRLRDPRPGDEDKVFALKMLRKVDVIRLKQVEHVRNERNVLAKVAGHPFITTMVASFQSLDTLYMVLDYCPGGEVFSYLRRARRFNEPTSQFYAAEIVLILEFLHEREGVAYRDLKPENILIDSEGHLKLVDFGFAKKIENRETYTLCGTPEYLAPEVIRNTGMCNRVWLRV
jgi:protein kinase A